MAKREVFEVTDDLDGEVLEEYDTITYTIDGRTYEIDLSVANAEAMRAVFQEYVDHSRPVTNRGKVTRRVVVPSATAGRSREENQAIRDWARKNGYEMSDRGRIQPEIVAAFDAAHQPKRKTADKVQEEIFSAAQ